MSARFSAALGWLKPSSTRPSQFSSTLSQSLDGGGVDRDAGVVAVAGGLVGVAVQVVALVHVQVAVVVDAVADLDGAGVDRRVGRVAVGADVEGVAIVVLVHVAVAVVVDAVADLGVAREVARLAVVAVAGEGAQTVVVAVGLEGEDHHLAGVGLLAALGLGRAGDDLGHAVAGEVRDVRDGDAQLVAASAFRVGELAHHGPVGAGEDHDAAGVAAAGSVVVVGAGGDVGQAVAVDVGHRGDGDAQLVVGRAVRVDILPYHRPVGAGEEDHAAAVRSRVVVVAHADEDVGHPVAGEVADAGQRFAEVIAGVAAGFDELADQRAVGAGEEQDAAQVGAVEIVVEAGADGNVGQAVAVHVAQTGHGVAELVAGPAQRVGQLEQHRAVGAGEDRRAAGAVSPRSVVFVGAGDDLHHTVAVDVVQGGHGETEAVVGQAVGVEQLPHVGAVGAGEEVDRACVGAHRVVVAGADGDVGDAVSGHVPDARGRDAQVVGAGRVGIGHAADRRAVGAGVEQGAAGIGNRIVVVGDRDHEVVDAVGVHVAEHRHGMAVPVVWFLVEGVGEVLRGAGLVEILVDQAVAVLVDVVAELGRTGVDRRVRVVAVAGSLVGVAVEVVALVHVQVAVVVDAVAYLDGAGVDRRVGRVAVGADVEGVAIVVLVHVAVAVVVDAVADLGVTREVGRLAVVAVSGDGADAIVVAVGLEGEDHHLAGVGLLGALGDGHAGNHVRLAVASDVGEGGDRSTQVVVRRATVVNQLVQHAAVGSGEDHDAAGVAAAGSVVKVGTGGDVGNAVAADVRHRRDRDAQLVAGQAARVGQLEHLAAVGAGENDHAAAVRACFVVVAHAGEDVGHAVTGNVADAGHRIAQIVVAHAGRVEQVPDVGAIGAGEDHHAARVGSVDVVVEVGTDGDVGHAVAVHVTDAGHREAELVPRRRDGILQLADEAAVGAGEDRYAAAAAAGDAVVIRRACGDVGHAVAGDVAQPGHRPAEVVVGGGAGVGHLAHPGAIGAGEEVHRAGGVGARVVVARAEDHVGDAVASGIADTCRRPPHLVGGGSRGVGHAAENRATRAGVEQAGAGVVGRVVVVGDRDHEVADAVAVHVADVGHGVAVVVVGALVGDVGESDLGDWLGEAVVGDAVAVVVDLVADLDRGRPDARVVVDAVAAEQRGVVAAGHRAVGVAVRVRVGTGLGPCRGRAECRQNDQQQREDRERGR